MDFLDCSICQIHYDENDRRPRNSPCGHEYCSTCLKTLIIKGEYFCPKCSQHMCCITHAVRGSESLE